MEKKKLGRGIGLVAVLIGIFCTLFLVAGARPAAAGNISVLLDGKPLNFDIMPQIVNGRLMVPMRNIFEPLGFTVTWQQETQSVNAIKNGLTVELKIGDSTAMDGTKQITLDSPPVVIDGRTLVPLRFVAEAAGDYVSWDGDNQIVRISTNPQTPPTGTPAAQGNYQPGQQLVLVDKVTTTAKIEIDMDADALTAPAQVSLYAVSASVFRLVLGAEPIVDNTPGIEGITGAHIVAKYIETGSIYMRRPVMEANGEMTDDTVYFSTDADGNNTITSCVKVAEQDTNLAVNDATDQQWSQVDAVY